MEADAIRSLGFRQPIAVIPNGVELPDNRATTPDGERQRTVLFMSRIHPKKGLLDLIAAWSRIPVTGWQLIIAGPDEDGYRSVVEKAVARERVAESVRIIGPVAGADKGALLGDSDLFVLPSYSENFGMVVGEALAAGVPVITTSATPWESVRAAKCGWWIPPGVDSLEITLREAMSLPDSERTAMGQRGRSLAESEYSWRSSAEKHCQLYRWLAGGTVAPAWVLE
jgi:glycosyltransferase involved in cell wall biosynthesis